MIQRWIVSDKGKLTEYPSGVAICKKYKCSSVSLYARVNCGNKNFKSPIFGRDIRVFRLEGDFGDEIDENSLAIHNCETCDKPVNSKNVVCNECVEKNNKINEIQNSAN